MMREQLPRARKIYGDQHPSTYMLMSRFGTILIDENKLAEAEPLLAEAYNGMKRLSTPTAPPPNFAAVYGDCLSRLGRHREAIPLLSDALGAFASLPAVDPALWNRVTQALITSYEQTGQPDQARQIRDRATTRPGTSATTRSGR